MALTTSRLNSSPPPTYTSSRTPNDISRCTRTGGWHQLVDQAIGGHAQLTTVIRQHNPRDREVCAAIRDGHAPQALADLQGRGRLHLSTDRSTAVKELVHAWDHHRHVRGMEGVAVTDTDNATVDVL